MWPQKCHYDHIRPAIYFWRSCKIGAMVAHTPPDDTELPGYATFTIRLSLQSCLQPPGQLNMECELVEQSKTSLDIGGQSNGM
eukprot:1091786-Amphidinium_carterae.1